MSHGARRQQFAAASRFWSIPNLMPRSTVTRVWLTEWAHLGQLVVRWHLTFFFFFLFVVSWVLFDKTVTEYRVWRKVHGTAEEVRSNSMLSSDSWLIDIGERSHPNPMQRRPIRCSSATSKTGNMFGWSFFFAVWRRRCARSQLHMNSVVLVESQGSCALVRIARLQKFDRRDNMIFTVHLNRSRTHHWSSPRSKLADKKPTSTRKLRKFPVTSGQGSKHRDWTASRWWARWRSQSSSCQHHVITWRGLIPADHEYLDSVAWPSLRSGTSVAPWRHKSSHVPVFRRLFDRLPVRISTSDLHHWILRKKLYHIRAYDFGVQFSFNVGGQTGKDCLLTWADGVKVADRRDRTRNLSLRKRCTNHCTTGPHTCESMQAPAGGCTATIACACSF